MASSSTLAFTPIEEIDRIHARLHAGFKTGTLKSLGKRQDQLLQLAYMLKENQSAFEEALAKDLGRPKLETNFLEVAPLINEAVKTIKDVPKWAAPEKPPFNINFFAMKPVIRKEAKGVVLIIAPFNYPYFLTIGPLIGAIAAGNACVVKPSELTPTCSQLMADLFPKYLDPDLYAVVNGAIPETTRLLELKWDHILYTGNSRVAKIVAKAAAERLTPVSLELGGKSPVFVDPNCDLKMTARRLLWGKVANAGQTCVAPDYVLVPREFQDTLVKALEDTYKDFYPEGPAKSDSFSRIVSGNHFNRIKKLLDGTQGQVVLGGDTNEGDRYIAPTVVKNVPTSDSLMSDEIFGPLLPIVPVKDLDEAIAFVNSGDHPLALYVFSNDAKTKKKVFDSTQSGAACANELIIHIGAEGLPFGGIGPSGTGYHTGKFTFDMFTHLRASIDSPGWIDMILNFRFPPYTAKKERALARMFPTKLPRRDAYSSAKSQC
ncbi:NAD-aldehyde dehydrogenase [Punctularia strigosozonata HHB-11173 SS5]|uniref:NAD-aldehyde dehydrogenase n=1 Tax=Punctularia strigosozonata (strain HHB-11173) TaxID=741275 RepID=UPI000441783E|nr:NAD-aldehyde dehydrogenase [Punctularia strigosozonata HHB-11173 SS5]EIN08576.1 NAD-aldehyde dehydrogenase [Punctularia strigosozonata HHB-11173 SS5]